MNATGRSSTATVDIPEWTLGWRMQRALAFAGLQVTDMISEFDVTRGTISRWMNDKGAPPKSIYLRAWAARCGVPYEWLINEPTSSPAGEAERTVTTGWTLRSPFGVVGPRRIVGLVAVAA
jgi:transcriptional regulator with XRE-family HTH domain